MTLAALVLCVLLQVSFPLCIPASDDGGQGLLRFESRSADLGEISDDCGLQELVFPFENISKSSLRLHVETSCSCLEAVAPEVELAPGAKDSVVLRFNPSRMAGRVDLRAMVYTDDGAGSVRMPEFIEVHALVLQSDPWDWLPVRVGPLAMKRNAVNFHSGEKTATILCANTSDIPIEPALELVPDFLEAAFDSPVVPPGSETYLVLRLRAEGRNCAFALRCADGMTLIRVTFE